VAQPCESSLRRIERTHERARLRRPGPLYAVVRFVAAAILRFWFRLRVEGAEHVPEHGAAAVVAANHKSFLDAFFIGLATRRHVRFMAKVELFRGPFARLLPRLGAFPVRRGEADAEALTTALAILRDGGLVVVFPEGTRVDEPDALGSPHHGAGRLAIDAGVPILPTAIAGTSHLWLGPVPKPRRIQVSFLPAVRTAAVDGADVREALEDLIDRRVWPAVQVEYGRLQATPGVIAAALAAVGLGGLAARRGLASGAPARVLGRIEPKRLRRARRRRVRLDRLRRR
jgi:1-acyl-sn-glycerol-3-phosphate acyltransferase